jgi:hypothetical protein
MARIITYTMMALAFIIPVAVNAATPQSISSLRVGSSGSDSGSSDDAIAAAAAAPPHPHPINAPVKPATPVWPHQFGAMLFQNRSSALAITNLYYDWRRGRNLNLITSQLKARGEVWDIEHDNGTSFVFSRDPAQRLCKVLTFDVGILRPNWLSNATLLGQVTRFVLLCWWWGVRGRGCNARLHVLF